MLEKKRRISAFERKAFVSRSRAVVARQAHNLKVGGSIPPSATKEILCTLPYMRFFCAIPLTTNR